MTVYCDGSHGALESHMPEASGIGITSKGKKYEVDIFIKPRCRKLKYLLGLRDIIFPTKGQNLASREERKTEWTVFYTRGSKALGSGRQPSQERTVYQVDVALYFQPDKTLDN